jgi:2-polyprenyl-3-methyl-5-hydroxy-6-metoxy-1,4-benzoquinol methylase
MTTTVPTVAGYVPFDPRPYGAHGKMLSLVPPGSHVLDAGCSSGYLAEQLVARGCAVTGLELDPEAARLAERWCERVLVGDVERIDLDLEPSTFDVVLCGDILEHLRDPRAALARWRPLLRPGGTLVLSTPNIANWSIRVALLFGSFRYTDRGILDRTHAHLFTRKSLLESLRLAGYRAVVEDFTVPLPHVIRKEPLERAAHGVGRLRPTLFAYQWVMAAVPA